MKNWIASIVVALAGLASGQAAGEPNIVLIMADDMGYECVTANGGESYSTPNLDRLARGGMRFEHCYSQPICTPSRVQLMTGIYNQRNYIRFGLLDPTVTTFGHLAKRAGYATCIGGKWQLENGLKGPNHFGFDEYCLWQLTRRPSPYPNPGLEVGVLLDASAQHAGRTGREVLRVAQETMGLPRDRVEEMLDLVSLTPEEAKRRVRDYSLGMRQRLGLATALLGDPAVLVLDEPANGLDPAGIRWMRDLLRDHAARGGTVLLSSHLLHEIEVIADDIVVIGQGRVVAQGTKEELLHDDRTLVRAAEIGTLAAALQQAGWTVERVDPADPGAGLRTDASLAVTGQVALEARLPLLELRAADGAGLEEMFLQLTADTQRETQREAA